MSDSETGQYGDGTERMQKCPACGEKGHCEYPHFEEEPFEEWECSNVDCRVNLYEVPNSAGANQSVGTDTHRSDAE